MDPSEKKIEAIYELRDAAEEKAHAEHAFANQPTAEQRDALLDAQMNLEEKTFGAIVACHECGHEHGPDEPHFDRSKVIELRRREKPD